MRKGIDTVPKNGDFVILEDDAIGKYAVARWSSDAAQWIDEGGAACGLNPTHWQPFNSGGYVPEASDELGAASAKAGQALVRAHRAALRHVRAPGTERSSTRRVAVRTSLAASGTRVRAKLQSWRATLTTAQERYRVAIIVAGLGIIALAGVWSYRHEIADLGDRLFVSATTDNDLMQARRALREEQEKSSKLAGDLAEARRQVGAQARLAEGVQQEQAEAERLRGELAAAKREIEAQTARARAAGDEAAKAKEAGLRVSDDLRQALRAEVNKAEQLRGELAAAARVTEAQAASARTANEEAERAKEAAARASDELGRTLRSERDKVEKLAGELAASKREIEAQTASLRTANEEVAKTKAANAQTVDQLQRALQDERDKAEKLRGELETVARERDAQEAQARATSEETARTKEASARIADEGGRSLQVERGKAEELAGELDRARAELDTLTRAKTSNEAAQRIQLEELRQGLQREAAEAAVARDAVEAERVRRQQLEQQLATRSEGQSAPGTASGEVPAQAEGKVRPRTIAAPGVEKTEVVAERGRPQGIAIARPAAPPVQANTETVRLLARASLLLEQGNIGAARNMLDRAAETGSPDAVFALAETYDPMVLAARQTVGTQSDAGKARELYQKALAGGIGEAKARLDALRQ